MNNDDRRTLAALVEAYTNARRWLAVDDPVVVAVKTQIESVCASSPRERRPIGLHPASHPQVSL